MNVSIFIGCPALTMNLVTGFPEESQGNKVTVYSS